MDPTRVLLRKVPWGDKIIINFQKRAPFSTCYFTFSHLRSPLYELEVRVEVKINLGEV